MCGICRATSKIITTKTVLALLVASNVFAAGYSLVEAAPSRKLIFDPDYMRALFDLGEQHGRDGTAFRSEPTRQADRPSLDGHQQGGP
jgi:hypothetical protein